MATDTMSPDTGYAGREPIKAPDWHGLVAWDLLLNNLSSGLYMVAALCELVSPDVFAPLAKWAYPVALGFLVGDLFLLTVDLGDMMRFHHMLRVFKPSSPMSLGVWSMTVFSLPLTLVVLLELLPGGTVLELVRRAVVVAGIAPAFAVAFYKGVLLSTTAQPGWRDARWFGGYLASGAVLLGCAEMVALGYVVGQPAALAVLRRALIALIIFHALPSSLLVIQLRHARERLFARRPLQRYTLPLQATAGVILSLGLALIGGEAALLAAVAVIVIGNMGARFVLIQLPHSSVRAGSVSDGQPASVAGDSAS
jgi:hypothetical protein